MNTFEIERGRLYDQAQAGELLGPPGQPLSRAGLFQLRKRGAIRFIRRGRRILFTGAHLIAFLESAEDSGGASCHRTGD